MDTTALLIVFALIAGAALGFHLGQRSGAAMSARTRDELRALTTAAAAESGRQVMAFADQRADAAERVVEPVRDSLDRLDARLGKLVVAGASWQSQLKAQVESVHLSGEELRRETRALSEALRRPDVRGHWGEQQLRRSLELAGLTEHCSFEQQVSVTTEDGTLRPDVVVTMPEGKRIVIDAKVPLDAFLTATSSADPAERHTALLRHVAQVRRHIDGLGAKAYWTQFAPSPEFVVMFIPVEAMYAQAVESDPSLLEYAERRGVIPATPTTLIAMLKTISYAWRQEALTTNAREIHQLGRELYDRLGKVGGHLESLGRSLNASVGSYNQAVGSLERRVFVSARKMRDLGVTDAALDSPVPLAAAARPLGAPEFVDADDPAGAVDEPVIGGKPGQERWVGRASGD